VIECLSAFGTLFRACSSGGIQVAVGDGSVRTVAQGIAQTTWWYAFTPAGGEPLPADW
jgi:hypothetical protein